MDRRKSPSLCRRRAGRRAGDGNAACAMRPSRAWRTALGTFFVLASAWLMPSSFVLAECTGGYPGHEAGGVCCFEGCGTCGGSGCSDIEDTRGDEDCCINAIRENGIICGVNRAIPPCILPMTPAPAPAGLNPVVSVAPSLSARVTSSPILPVPTGKPSVTIVPTAPTMAPMLATKAPVVPPLQSSTCENGIVGHQSSNICCALACGRCGGSDCGIIPNTGGAASCCVDTIRESGVTCGVAPCIISPTPAITPSPTKGAPPVAPPSLVTQAPLVGISKPTIAPVSNEEGDREVSATPAPSADVAIGSSSAPVSDSSGSECSNGQPGHQHGVVCCPIECGQCGGSGCETIDGTVGASDCCSDVVLGAQMFCNSTVAPPCIIGTADEVAASIAANGAARASGILVDILSRTRSGMFVVYTFSSAVGFSLVVGMGWWA